MLKVWVGTRESDILTYNYFDYSITFYGSGKDTNFSYCDTIRERSNYKNSFTQFVINNIDALITQYKHIEIHFYNSVFAHKILELQPNFYDSFKNLNSAYVLNVLRHKSLSRLWLSNSICVPAFTTLSKDECRLDNLIRKFGSFNNFVIQKNFSGGGAGTYLLNAETEKYIHTLLSDNELFLVSPYYENSQNFSCHMIIGEKTQLIFPASKQLLDTSANHLSYCGNDHAAVTANEKSMLYDSAKRIAKQISKIGYRGICGADFIINNNKIMLIEINPRFMGSSFAINYALKKANYKSLFELNDISFNGESDLLEYQYLENLTIDINNYCVFYNSSTDRANQLYNELRTTSILFEDGWLNAVKYEEHAYLFRYLLPL